MNPKLTAEELTEVLAMIDARLAVIQTQRETTKPGSVSRHTLTALLDDWGRIKGRLCQNLAIMPSDAEMLHGALLRWQDHHPSEILAKAIEKFKK